VDLNWECDVAILATNQPGMNLIEIIKKETKILEIRMINRVLKMR
jgi:hypothetical protein